MSPSFTQLAAAFGTFLLTMQLGINIGWTSPNLVYLTSENSTIQATPKEISMMISYKTLAGIAGTILGSILIEFIGSKKALLMTVPVISSSWIFLIIANSFTWIFVSRILCGITASWTCCAFPRYLGEVSKPENRGTLISIAASGSPFGIVIGTVTETYLPMKISSSIYLAICLVAGIIFIWLMESPYHMVRISDYERARKSVDFYYVGCDLETVLSEIKNFVEADNRQSIKDKLQALLRSPVLRKSIPIVMILAASAYTSGKMMLLYYMESILISSKFNLIPPEQFVIYANIIAVVTLLLTAKSIDILGRRLLLIVASIGTATSLSGLGIYFHLLNLNIDVQNLQWIPIVTIIVFLISYAFAFTSVPSTVLSEIFPQKIKSVALFIVNMSTPIVGFTFMSGYQLLVDSLGQAYTFWINAGICLLATTIVLYFLPETKGKTFQEIQNDLHENKNKDANITSYT